ncbi:MAG: hypothetical protein WBD20_11095 [Pirellulaceae bacterium]
MEIQNFKFKIGFTRSIFVSEFEFLTLREGQLWLSTTDQICLVVDNHLSMPDALYESEAFALTATVRVITDDHELNVAYDAEIDAKPIAARELPRGNGT